MLLKRIDETIQLGNYDLGGLDPVVDVYIVKPAPAEKLFHWEIVEEGTLQRQLLHYDDIEDGSQKLSRSWQTFYAEGKKLGQGTIYSGSSFYFKKGFPLFGGVAKSALYLRYSAGFIAWLKAFDPGAAERLTNEIPAFEALIGDSKTKKLPGKWHDFKAPKGKWPLIELCSLSAGNKHLVLWLEADAADANGELADLNIEVERSLEIMTFLTAPATPAKKMIDAEFQSGSGLGRNAFGKTFKLDDKALSYSEYNRLLGVLPASPRRDILSLWSNKAEYRVKVAPSPDTSSLIFLPEGKDFHYSDLKNFIDDENSKRRLFYFKQKNKQKQGQISGTADIELVKVSRPDFIPGVHSATVYLTNLEGGTKKKRIIQQIFPSVSLVYLRVLNAELLNSNLQEAVISFMKAALTGQKDKGDTPSVYRYWTVLFTRALQKQPVAAWELYNNFQRFAKSFSGAELIEKGRARDYFRAVGKVLRLQHLIVTARTGQDYYKPKFQRDLSEIEAFNNITKGVFGNMNTSTVPPIEELLPAEVCGLLRDKQKSKLESFVRQAWYGVPNEDFAVFVRGALTGMLLNELCYMVTQEGRRFTATQGRHPSRLRGRELMNVFDKGVGLLMNLDKARLFNCDLLPFVKSREMESRRDSFNSGLIVGMVYWGEKDKKEDNESNHEVNND